MSAVAIFDAKAWIAAICAGGTVLTAETLSVVSNFTLMWNLFEHFLCDDDARPQKFSAIAGSIPDDDRLLNDIRCGLQFWTRRYRAGSEFNSDFRGLKFRANDGQRHVEAVLSGAASGAHCEILAVLFIVHRLRNNLFHGLKTLDTLNDQVCNLDMACRALGAIMVASRRTL
jgi:hypothetical protein